LKYRRSTFWLWIIALSIAYGQTPAPLTATATYGDRLIYGALRPNHFSINPFRIESDLQRTIVQLIFGYGLLKTPGKIASPPTLIEQYSHSDDYRVWRILIKRNVVFQNAQIMRNTDVQFTFQLLKQHNGYILNRPLEFKNIRKIETNGDLEIVFTLFQPDRNFLDHLADVPIVPKDYYADAMQLGLSVFTSLPPMGMGPFQLAFLNSETIVLRYHLQYIYGRPFLDEVHFRLFDDEQLLIDALVNGAIDYSELPDRNTTDRLLDLMRSKINVFLTPRPEHKLFLIVYNVRHPVLQDANVRKAINMAINKEFIVERFAKSIAVPAHSLFPEDSPYFRSEFSSGRFRPRESLQLLKATGWRYNRQTRMLEKNNQPLSITLYFAENSTIEQNIARTIKLNLAEINVDIKPVPIPGLSKQDYLNSNRFEAMIYVFEYDPRYPFVATELFFDKVLGASLDVPNYQNNYLRQLIDMVRDTPEKHINLFERIQYYLNREVPATFLFFDTEIIIGLDKRFAAFRDIVRTRDKRMFFRLNPIENWYVPKNLQKYP
jgi:peptide/nickel transport system substrate-binding protein